TAAPQPHQRRHRPLPHHEKDTPNQHRLPRLATRRHRRVGPAAASRARPASHALLLLVPNGSVRHGDWAVAGECLVAEQAYAEPLALGGALFSSWTWRSIGLVASPE